MKDASKKVTKALPNAAASNQTDTIDLGTERPFDNKQRLAHVEISVPALTDHTDSSKTNLFVLQESSDDSSYADTNPMIECKLVGVTTSGSAATTFKVPLPPGVKRYIQFTQTVPSGSGTGTNATVTYALVT
jgi:hypothetical protein